jgi:UDP-3-O-[3-hydroxymyristoyl] glucosamine N-acyltransferase
VIGQDVIIGKHVTIGKNVTLENCTIGDYVHIKNGASIGQDGFGWIPATDANSQHIKKPQTKRYSSLTNISDLLLVL